MVCYEKFAENQLIVYVIDKIGIDSWLDGCFITADGTLSDSHMDILIHFIIDVF